MCTTRLAAQDRLSVVFFLFMYTGEVGEKKNCEKHRGGNEQHFSFSYMFSLQLNAYVSHYTTLHLIDHLIPDCFKKEYR